ncbi:maltotransferase domain-containing protein, partial [Streptomyces sp. NPDC007070]|uniref:maltotransferase domain-containing protein n=1 Tax=Streptomyces sp. NPDC007070 TaxID=3154312 RepID=UPI0033D7DBEC
MPATHHPAPPGTTSKRPRDAGPQAMSGASDAPPSSRDAAADGPTAVGRIPVLDVRPVVQHGRRPAKAVTGESFEITATVFREGHDAVAANVVLRDPEGRLLGGDGGFGARGALGGAGDPGRRARAQVVR